MKYLLILITSFLSGFLSSQRPDVYCEIDFKQSFEVTCFVYADIENSSNLSLHYSISNLNQDCDKHKILLDSNLNKLYFRIQHFDNENWKNFYKDSIRYYLDSIKIVKWSLIFYYPKEKEFDISKLDPFKGFNVTNVRDIDISSRNSTDERLIVNIRLNIKKWSIYKDLKECNVLQRFNIPLNFIDYRKNDKKYFKLLSEFKQLRTIGNYNYYHNYNFSSFENLEYFESHEWEISDIQNPFMLFDLRLLHLPKLKQPVYTFFNTYQKRDVNDEYYAEKYFFFQELNHNANNDPLKIIDSLIKLKNITPTTKQKVVLLNKDLYSDTQYPEDTLASGYIENNQKIGLWRFYFSAMYDNDTIFFDFSRAQTIIPKDGHWAYYYHSGQKAIEGNFRHGKKTGEWVIYNLDGSKKWTKNYKKDLLSGSIFRHYKNIKSIAFYFLTSSKYLNIYYLGDDKDLYDINISTKDLNHNIYGRGRYYYYSDHKLIISKNYKVIKTIPIDSKRCKRILNRKLLKKLFPDYKTLK